MSKSEVLDFIKAKNLMVVSSLNEEGFPQAAVVGFGETEDLELVFGTSNLSRKYGNIQRNPHVAVVIGWDGPMTVQIEGTAREITGAEADRYSELYFAKNPYARKHKELPDEVYMLIEPSWLKTTDLRTTPWTVSELKFSERQ